MAKLPSLNRLQEILVELHEISYETEKDYRMGKEDEVIRECSNLYYLNADCNANLGKLLIDIRLRHLEIDDINKLCASGETLLMYTIYNEMIENAYSLLAEGADPCIEDQYGNSALSLSIRSGNIELTQAFIKVKLQDKYEKFQQDLSEDEEGLFHFIGFNTLMLSKLENICESDKGVSSCVVGAVIAHENKEDFSDF